MMDKVNTSLLLRDVESLPPSSAMEVIDFVAYLKQKHLRRISKPPAVDDSGITYPPDFDARLKGAVSPALYGKGKISGDIIGPFHDEWGDQD
jgi:hypothetical protein